MKEMTEEQALRIRRNLKDAGCGIATVTQFLDLSSGIAAKSNTGCSPARRRHCCKSCTASSIKLIASTIWFTSCNKRTNRNGGIQYAKSNDCDPRMG